jgi:hypothetical protein
VRIIKHVPLNSSRLIVERRGRERSVDSEYSSTASDQCDLDGWDTLLNTSFQNREFSVQARRSSSSSQCQTDSADPPTMSSEATMDCMPTAEVQEAVVSIDDQCNRKACRVIITTFVSLIGKSESESVFDATTGELVETIYMTLGLLVSLMYGHDNGKVETISAGGVEEIVKVMQTFPNCQKLQRAACAALYFLTLCSIGKKKAVESGGMEVLLAALDNHLYSADICDNACCTLFNIVDKSKERTRIFISLNGDAAIAKVGNQWPDNAVIQTEVRSLAKSIGTEISYSIFLLILHLQLCQFLLCFILVHTHFSCVR